MNSLTLPKQLTAIDCYDWKTYFKDCTVEYATQFKKAQFQSLDWSIVTGSNIKAIRNATSLEFFEQFVLPTLPTNEKEMYFRIRSWLPEKLEREIKLEQILSAIERKKQEEKYYQTKPLSEEELARRREQVKNRPKLNLA